MNRQFKQINPLYALGALILFLLVIIYVVKGLYQILLFVFPFLIIAAFFIDRDVVINYFKGILNHFKNKNYGMGIIMALVTVFGFPFVSAFLLAKAYFKKQIVKKFGDIPGASGSRKDSSSRRNEEGYTDYEEVVDEDDFLDLPELNKEYAQNNKRTDTSSDYEQLFD